MTREEFFQWLNTCPTHKWEIVHDDSDFIRVVFPVEEDEDEEDNAGASKQSQAPTTSARHAAAMIWWSCRQKSLSRKHSTH